MLPLLQVNEITGVSRSVSVSGVADVSAGTDVTADMATIMNSNRKYIDSLISVLDTTCSWIVKQ